MSAELQDCSLKVTLMRRALLCLMLSSVLLSVADFTPAGAQTPDVETVSFESVNSPGWFIRHTGQSHEGKQPFISPGNGGIQYTGCSQAPSMASGFRQSMPE
jgi:hypothetical protein